MHSAGARRDSLLEKLAQPGQGPIAARDTAIVLAHPDDETIACGATMARLDGVRFVMVTDGSPRDERDAHRRGFTDADSYAAARARELSRALDLAGVRPSCRFALGVPDQQAVYQLARVARAIAHLLREHEIASVVTHAYEGGHPDHDATAFAVHAAAAMATRAGAGSIEIVEVPLYHEGPGGCVRQRFPTHAGEAEVALALSDEQRALKAKMAAAHATQADVLSLFQFDTERFRRAPAYDFAELPNNGVVFHERCEWGLDGAMWRRLAVGALRELGLVVTSC